jgi:beta-N-acetylhexosaminidase
MNKWLFNLMAVSLFFSMKAMAQISVMPAAESWADSVLASLTVEERIAQLMVIRTSAPGKEGAAVFYDQQVNELVSKYNVGGVCLFQGTPQQQATLLNRIQQMAKTPIMVTVDGEWGLGMRFAGVRAFPYQLTLGAMQDAELVYRVGRAIAAQCRRMNIHVNYAPVVDINNNPNNPVIGYRSFGENREKVAHYGTKIMQGMQDLGVMACAKHFPGHGDVDVDSHYDLPVINKSMEQLDSLELYPFKALFAAGVGSVMIAHLYIPAIDNTVNRATSLSRNNVTKLMREKLGYQGLTFTDALEMKGVAKFFPSGEAAVESLVAGNDMLCLPSDVPQTIEAIKKAIASGRLSPEEIDDKCHRVLMAKFLYVMGQTGPIKTEGLEKDLNEDVGVIRKEVAEKALTVLSLSQHWVPLPKQLENTLMIQIGGGTESALSSGLKSRGARVITVGMNGAGANAAREAIQNDDFTRIVVSIQALTRSPANNFGISEEIIKLVKQAGKEVGSSFVLFGNPYGLGVLGDIGFDNMVVAYEDDAIFQQAAFDWMCGLYKAEGTLPVSIGKWKSGDGIVAQSNLRRHSPELAGMDRDVLFGIEKVAKAGIDSGAFPGCVVTVLRKGGIVYQQAFGYYTYDKITPVSPYSIYDLASVTKTSATTMAVMKLYEEGILDVKATLGDYLPWVRGTDKESILIEDMLLHQSGLIAFIPFYREVIDAVGKPSTLLFSPKRQGSFILPVTEKMNMTVRWRDTMYSRILTSKLLPGEKRYVYSDNNFILLADVVKALTGKSIERYTEETFYNPLGMVTTQYKVFETFDQRQIVPTEREKQFRQGLLQGYVHDPGSAMFGNVAGHAGLFSNAWDLAKLYQLLLNGGKLDTVTLFKAESIEKFTAYNSNISRRGYGFDKPEPGNDTLPADKKYPATFVSPRTYGHTGYTGTCVWVDPAEDLVYIFLSNRVHPEGGTNTKITRMNIRSRIQDIIYKSIIREDAETFSLP